MKRACSQYFLTLCAVLAACATRAAGPPPPAMAPVADAPASVINFRDVGGAAGLDGQCVRRGVAFRSGTFAETTLADARTLAAHHDLRVYYDLRSANEVEAFGSAAALDSAGVRCETMSIDAKDDPFLQTQGRDVPDWVGFYDRVFEAHGGTFVTLLDHLANGAVPAVYGCSLGKDRTGIATALLLGVLGVDQEAIVDDYSRSTWGLAPHATTFVRAWQVADDRSTVPLQRHDMTADPVVMRFFLRTLKDRYGSITAALAAHGLRSSTIAGLRSRFLGDC